MEPYATLLGDLEPHSLVELGRPDPDRDWVRPESLAAAQVVQLDDRDGLVANPDRLAAQLDAVGAPVDVLIDHATDDAAATLRIFEVAFARLASGGVHVVLGPLRSDVVLDLMLVSLVRPELIDGVTVMPSMVVIHRGAADPEPTLVRLADLRSDPFGVVVR